LLLSLLTRELVADRHAFWAHDREMYMYALHCAPARLLPAKAYVVELLRRMANTQTVCLAPHTHTHAIGGPCARACVCVCVRVCVSNH
jgi:hypothetical protein